MNYNERLSGNEAIAFAMKQIDPDVMAAFPITPSTEIPQYFAQYVANGEVNTEFVPVESEHSSMSACITVERTSWPERRSLATSMRCTEVRRFRIIFCRDFCILGYPS